MAQRNRHALGGSGDLGEPAAGGDLRCVGQDLVELAIVVDRVVVEQHESPGAGLGRDLDRVLDGAVAPVGLRRELGRRCTARRG